jgi:hypothetical protein
MPTFSLASARRARARLPPSSGKCNDRPELAKAIDRCQLTDATLVIAKFEYLLRPPHALPVIDGGEG